MKKIFSFILVVLMIVGVSVSILNFTANDLKADDVPALNGWYIHFMQDCVNWTAVDCYIITVTPDK